MAGKPGVMDFLFLITSLLFLLSLGLLVRRLPLLLLRSLSLPRSTGLRDECRRLLRRVSLLGDFLRLLSNDECESYDMDLDLVRALCLRSEPSSGRAIRSLGSLLSYPSLLKSPGRPRLRLSCDDSEVYDKEELRLRRRLRSTSRLEKTWL